MLKRYNYRAYLTGDQQQAAAQAFGCARVVFNDYLTASKAMHEAGQKRSSLVLIKQVTSDAKKTPERAFLNTVSSVIQQQSARDAELAFKNFFNSVTGKRKGRKVGFPRYKSKHDNRQSVRFTKQGYSRLRQDRGRYGSVYLAGIGVVKFVLSRELPSVPTSVTLTRRPDRTFELSFVVDVPENVVPPVHERAAGIDLGLTDFASIVYSDGTREKVENPRVFKGLERKLARQQRSLKRMVKGSKNREKQVVKVAKTHQKIRDTRKDFLNKLTTRLVRENQALAVETLSVSGLARSGKKGRQGRGMRKSVHDASWGLFLTLLEQKTVEHGRVLGKADRFDPTSQTCSVCGVKDGKKPLNIRRWACLACENVLDRDFNAAVNILVAAGLAETLNDCEGNVRRMLACANPVEAVTRRTYLSAA